MSTRFEKLQEWFSHPLNLLVGFIASVASILSIFLYFHSIENRELSFLTQPVRATIVKSGQSSRVKVSSGGKELTGDVTAVQIAFWNAGKRPIRKSEILEPIIVSIGADHPILEAALKKVSRELTHIRIDETELARGEVSLSWDILEKLDGAVLQLIYEGDASAPIKVRGVVEGQGSVSLQDGAKMFLTQNERPPRDRWWGVAPLIVTAVIALLLVAELCFSNRSHRTPKQFLLLIVILFLWLIIAAMQAWKYFGTSTPFGF